MQNDDLFKGIKNIEDVLARLERHSENAKALKELKEKTAAKSEKEIELRDRFPVKINCPKCGDVIVANAFVADDPPACAKCEKADTGTDISVKPQNRDSKVEVVPFKESIPQSAADDRPAGQGIDAKNQGPILSVSQEGTADPGVGSQNSGPTLSITPEGNAGQGMSPQNLGPTLSVTPEERAGRGVSSQGLGPTLLVKLE